MVARTLLVAGRSGAGKTTLIGNIIYQCGLDLQKLGQLERAGIRDVAKIPAYLEAEGSDLTFHTPSGLVTITKFTTTDIIMWIVDASKPDDWKASAQCLYENLLNGTFQASHRFIILINKMDLVDWSEQHCENAIQTFESVIGARRMHFVPASGLTGENLLVNPETHSWLSQSKVPPLIQLLD